MGHMIFEHQEYRTFLKSTLRRRAEAQEGYSLRAFSERLGISPSFLSEVMNAKKGLSVELALRVAVNLELTDAETQYLCFLVQLEQEKDPVYREKLTRRLKELNPRRPAHDLPADLFQSIAEWYHAAILELTYLAGFRLNAEAAARALQITAAEAEAALARLLRLGLLEEEKKGTYRKAKSYVQAESTVPNAAFREFHAQLLARAGAALRSLPPTERLSASDVVALDSRQLPQIDRLSREFSAAVLKLAERARTKDQVYALTVHCFPLTRTPRPS